MILLLDHVTQLACITHGVQSKPVTVTPKPLTPELLLSALPVLDRKFEPLLSTRSDISNTASGFATIRTLN